eukprot:1275576-Pleurochrysis_carterae.AAC.2
MRCKSITASASRSRCCRRSKQSARARWRRAEAWMRFTAARRLCHVRECAQRRARVSMCVAAAMATLSATVLNTARHTLWMTVAADCALRPDLRTKKPRVVDWIEIEARITAVYRREAMPRAAAWTLRAAAQICRRWRLAR